MYDELKQEIVGLESARTILQSVLARLELYREALYDANVRIYTGELWRIDPEGGELLEPLRVALERADGAEATDPAVGYRPRDLPEEGTWEWATWQMHQGEYVTPDGVNTPHRIHEGRLQDYIWGVREWRDHPHIHEWERPHDDRKWELLVDPDGALTE